MVALSLAKLNRETGLFPLETQPAARSVRLFLPAELCAVGFSGRAARLEGHEAATPRASRHFSSIRIGGEDCAIVSVLESRGFVRKVRCLFRRFRGKEVAGRREE
jgi:hypothetical protein